MQRFHEDLFNSLKANLKWSCFDFLDVVVTGVVLFCVSPQGSGAGEDARD